MPIPMFPQQPMTVDDLVRQMMKNPAVAAKVRRDPKFGSKLVAKAEQQMRSFARAPTSDMQAVEMLRRAPIGSTLGAPIAEGTTSVADMVRAQRDGFLMADGTQVAGDYGTRIRQEQGGIAAPRMPSAGYMASSYHYPSRKMVTGAALAATPEASDFTNVRRPLPTGSFNPEFFVASRPDQQGNNLITNRPVRVPSVRDNYPSGSMFAEPQSPAEERRRNLSVLMGLPPMPSVRPTPVASFDARARFLRRRSLNGIFGDKYVPNYQFNTGSTKNDSWWILREGVQKVAFEKDAAGNKAMAWLDGLVAWADPLVVPYPNPGKVDPKASKSQRDYWFEEANRYAAYLENKKKYDEAACINPFGMKDIGLCTMEAAKSIARGIIVANILSDKIDFSAINVAGKNGNAWINENITNWVPPEYKPLVQGFNLMPLDLTQSPIRRYMIEQAYEEIWKAPIKDAWYEAISNELRNAKSGSLNQAVTFLRNSKYDPNAKNPPVVALQPGASSTTAAMNADMGAGRAGGGRGGRGAAPAEEAAGAGLGGNTLLIVGGVAAAALVGLGIYFRNK